MSSSDTQEPHMTQAWGNAMAQALEMEGLDSKSLFREAGVPYQFSADPACRIETRQASALYRLAVEITGNPAFGIKVAHYMQPLTLNALGYSIFASSTLFDFCKRLENYFRLVSDNASHRLVEKSNGFHLEIAVSNTRVSLEAIDAWAAYIVQICRVIHRPDFSPLRVELVRPRPESHAEDFEKFFKSTLVYSAPRNTIVFRNEDIHERLPLANSDLARRNDEVVIEYLARLDKDDILRRVEAKIVMLLPTGECSKERVAAELGMSLSSLQKKLELKKINYQEILDELRSVLARQYMEQQKLPVGEIAYLLGFNDTSNFSRAFRRWTGQSPSDYRHNL